MDLLGDERMVDKNPKIGLQGRFSKERFSTERQII
jgi:hypothetical protein